ncbi:hypothetical protein ACXZ65_20190 [Streptomyces aculeolatus]
MISSVSAALHDYVCLGNHDPLRKLGAREATAPYLERSREEALEFAGAALGQEHRNHVRVRDGIAGGAEGRAEVAVRADEEGGGGAGRGQICGEGNGYVAIRLLFLVRDSGCPATTAADLLALVTALD